MTIPTSGSYEVSLPRAIAEVDDDADDDNDEDLDVKYEDDDDDDVTGLTVGIFRA